VCIIGRTVHPWPRVAGAQLLDVDEGRGRAVKKLLLIALAALGGLFVYRQIQADRAEQDLWTEATDSVPAGSATHS
jgi:hypothetical protein